MEPAERLADYLAGELSADETATVEADLARNPRLRMQLEALRSADAALGGLEPPPLPDGFEDRLRAAVDTELREHLGQQPLAAADAPAGDELGRRRAWRERSWAPALAGAAAVVVVLAGAVLAITNLPSAEDEAGVAMDAPVAEDADEAEEAAPEAMAAPEQGPTIVIRDREIGADDADALLEVPQLREVADRGLDVTAGGELAHAWREALRADVDPLADGEAADLPDDDTGAPDLRVFAEGPVQPADREDVDRCLDALAVDGEVAIPAYVEVLRFEGEAALAYGMVTRDPATGTFRRTELWIVAPDDCALLRFVQN